MGLPENMVPHSLPWFKHVQTIIFSLFDGHNLGVNPAFLDNGTRIVADPSNAYPFTSYHPLESIRFISAGSYKPHISEHI